MTATNHALTGMSIGLIIGRPLIALPLALLSHFICDALPHFGESRTNLKRLRSKGFVYYLFVEAGICFGLVVALITFQPAHWLLAAVCAFLATSPDLLWIRRYLFARKKKLWRPGPYAKFAGGIQWFQRPIGAFVEIAWGIGSLFLVVPFFR